MALHRISSELPRRLVAMGKEKLRLHSQQKTDSGWCWAIFAAACVIHFINFGIHYSFGLIFPHLLEEFGSGEGNTAWIGSIASGFLFFFCLLAVKVMNKTSVWLTCLFGGICAGCGLVISSFVQRFELLFITYSLLFGLGTSLLYTPSLIVVARAFTKYRDLTTGAVVACGSLGQLALSVPIELALEHYGLRVTLRIIGITFMVTSCLCACVFIPLVLSSNDDVGVAKESQIETSSNHQSSFRLLKNKAYVCWICVMVLTNFSYYIPIVHLFNFSRHLGFSDKEGSYLQVSLAISALIGRTLLGKISNTFPRRTVWIYQCCMFATGVCSLVAGFSMEYWHLVMYTVVYGLLDGSYMGLMSIVTLRISGLKDFAEAWGLMLCIIGIPLALGPAVVGWVNDAQLINNRSMFYIAATPVLLASLLMFSMQYHIWQTPIVHRPPGWTALLQNDELDDSNCLIERISVV